MAEFDFTTFPILTTPRLVLRGFTPGDAADFLSFHGDPEVQKFDSDSPLKDLAEAAEILAKIEQEFTSRKSINWGIVWKEENRVIGHLGLYFADRRYDSGDLGYTLARPYWRRGIATEAIGALLRFGFETLRLHRINVDTRMDNLASVGLMAKLGFTPEGVRRECIRNEDGSYQNWGLFGMLAEEYRR